MSDPNPPEQGSFGQPAGGTPPQPPQPSQQPSTPPLPPTPPSSQGPDTQRMPSSGGTTPPAPPAGGASGSPAPTTANVQAAVQSVASDSSGFISALFDFTFTRFVTPMLVRFVYLLATVALVASWLSFVIAGFITNIGVGFFALIIGPIIVIIYLAIVRMTLEFYLSVVRMSEDIHRRLPQG